jgi:iron uptake system component EfeO
LLPLASEASPDATKATTDAFAAVRAELGKLGGVDSTPIAYGEVPPDARKALAAAFVALADAIDRINPALGLE